MRRRLPTTRRLAADLRLPADDARPSTSSGALSPRGAQGNACAKQILSTLMRRAYRRPIADADLKAPMPSIGGRSRETSMRESGALSAVLVSPAFLFRVELDPDRVAEGAATASAISSWHHGCRFSVEQPPRRRTARRGHSRHAQRRTSSSDKPVACSPILDRTTSRAILRDSGSGCATWSRSTRTCVSIRTSTTTFVRRSSGDELFVDSILREDRSVRDLIKADYTFSQRAPGEALRHSLRLWRPVPARDACARSARGGLLRQEASWRHVVCDANVAGAAWRVGPRQHLRRAAASSAPNVPAVTRRVRHCDRSGSLIAPTRTVDLSR